MMCNDKDLVKRRPRVVAIIQARVGSTRLPSKVLRDIEGQTMLGHVVNRVKRGHIVDDVVVATTVNLRDGVIEELCQNEGWHCYRGSESDVLDRYYQAACLFKADAVVRVTSDCPLVDASLMDKVINKFLLLYPNIDYVSNVLPRRTYPRGLDAEVINIETLESEWRTSAKWREHVTLNLRNNAERFRTASVCYGKDYSFMRWCVDDGDDLEFVRKVYRQFDDDRFGWMDIVRLLEEYPDWIIKDTQVDPK